MFCYEGIRLQSALYQLGVGGYATPWQWRVNGDNDDRDKAGLPVFKPSACLIQLFEPHYLCSNTLS